MKNRWLAFLVTCFGSLCAAIGGAQNVQTLMALRFLLGAAEAGVYPGMIFYLSFWYGPRERAIRIAIFLCSATLAGAFGGRYSQIQYSSKWNRIQILTLLQVP